MNRKFLGLIFVGVFLIGYAFGYLIKEIPLRGVSMIIDEESAKKIAESIIKEKFPDWEYNPDRHELVAELDNINKTWKIYYGFKELPDLEETYTDEQGNTSTRKIKRIITGGCPSVIISAKDARVIKITHGL